MPLTIEQELKLIAVRNRWAYEELVYDQKMKEHNWHTSARVLTGDQEEHLFQMKRAQTLVLFRSLNRMLVYLLRSHKTPKQLLSSLRELVYRQGARRKTLCLISETNQSILAKER
jgi:hypothetical protein